MTGTEVAVSLGFAIVGIVTYGGVLHFYRSGKNEREKRRQVQSRIDRDDAKRAEAINVLEEDLKRCVCGHNPNEGMISLVRAQKALEDTFKDWLNEYWDLFYNFSLLADSRIDIVGIKDGTFKYELPDALRQYTKRNKK